jgi:hypothetical protein
VPSAGLSLISISYMTEKFPFKKCDLCFLPCFILGVLYEMRKGMHYAEMTSCHFTVIQYLRLNNFFIFMKFDLGVLHKQLSSYMKIGSVTAILYL